MSYFYIKCRDLNLAIKYLRRLTLKGAYEARDNDCPYRKWQALEIRDNENRIVWQATSERKEEKS